MQMVGGVGVDGSGEVSEVLGVDVCESNVDIMRNEELGIRNGELRIENGELELRAPFGVNN